MVGLPQDNKFYGTNDSNKESLGKLDCEQLGGHVQRDRSAQSIKTHAKLLCLGGLLSLVFLVQRYSPASFLHRCIHGLKSESVLPVDDLCPQAELFTPPEHETLLRDLDGLFGSSAFKLKAYESLGGAVRIPTECHDDFGHPSEDPRWEIMTEFHQYLETRFPGVHAELKRTKVNTYSLVYEWEGTENVKPLLFSTHMDVVPVDPDTYDNWVHPPYSGHYDGEWIWGRGSCDDKAPLTATLTAIESLLERGFVPTRTVLLVVDFDEECESQGARAIGEYLLETRGPNSIALLVDEGDGFSSINGTVFATPSIAEKGYTDIRMDVLTPGGHSSTPPQHTGIGILADLITELEAHPHEPELIRGGPYYQSLECRARYDTGFPEPLIKLLLESRTSDEKLRELGNRLADFDPLYYAMSGTTQAIDVIGGGVKVNALPEVAWAIANHRIAGHSSVTELTDRFTDITIPVSARHNMTLEAFGDVVGPRDSSSGTIRLHIYNDKWREPSPVAPTAGSGPFELLSGTIRSTFGTHLRTDDLPRSAIVSPWLATSNSDTKHYLNLTKHIFRYHHRGLGDVYNGIHADNEAIRAEGFLEQIRFFTRLIVNADRSDLLD